MIQRPCFKTGGTVCCDCMIQTDLYRINEHTGCVSTASHQQAAIYPFAAQQVCTVVCHLTQTKVGGVRAWTHAPCKQEGAHTGHTTVWNSNSVEQHA